MGEIGLITRGHGHEHGAHAWHISLADGFDMKGITVRTYMYVCVLPRVFEIRKL